MFKVTVDDIPNFYVEIGEIIYIYSKIMKIIAKIKVNKRTKYRNTALFEKDFRVFPIDFDFDKSTNPKGGEKAEF